MTNITTLIEKYQGLIKAETDYLASPEGQSSPEYQRIFATQKAFFYQGFVDELEKVNPWISVKDRLPDIDNQYIVCYKMPNENWYVYTTGYSLSYRRFDTCNINITHWQPLPTAPTI